MARINLDHLAHAYRPNPQGPQDYALKEINHVWDQGGAYALLGPSAAARPRCSTSSRGSCARPAAASCSTTGT
jgi:hypothetical protein